MNYFSRYSIPISSKNANVADLKEALRYIFTIYRAPGEIYCDRGQHFLNEELKQWLKSKKVKYTYSPSGSSRSTGLIESENKLIENMIRKSDNTDWDLKLRESVKSLNRRIIKHLGVSPEVILLGSVPPLLAIDSKLLTISSIQETMET